MKPVAERGRGGAKTRLIEAFNEIFMTRRASQPRVAEVIQHARVARSTFYDHYSGIDDLHMTALARPLSTLADAIAGRGGPESLQRLLDHLWQNRDRARTSFGGDTLYKVERLLAGLVIERLDQSAASWAIPQRLAAAQLSAAQLSLIRAWLAGEAHCESGTLAHTICRTSESLRAQLFPSGNRAR